MLSKQGNSRAWLTSKVIICSLLMPTAVWGQVVPDGTTPTPDPGTCIPLCTIADGIVDPTGTNLFHSFTQFSVPEGGTVVFDHSATIRNVITRVTGGNESRIDGTIRTNLASETNLFLLNPRGIFFGPNGQLDIGGSFVATTADAIQFEGQGDFSAIETNSDFALLTVDPSAFLFTQATPQPITSQASAFNFSTFTNGLIVPQNKSLLLVGGDVVIETSPTVSFGSSAIRVPGGRFELGGLRDAGIVELIIDGDNLSTIYPNNIELADVFLLNKAVLNTFGGASRAGTLVINANNLVMDDSRINTTTFGSDDAGEVLITTNESVILKDSTIASLTNNSGDGGGITIVTDILSLTGSSMNTTTSEGVGDAGTINLSANAISLSENSNIISAASGSESSPAGSPGEIVIQTNNLSIDDSDIDLRTSGNVLAIDNLGNLIIYANNRVSIANDSEITSQTDSRRDAGDIAINTPLLVIDSSRISAEVLPGTGSSIGATGQGGQIQLDTQQLSLNNAQITTSTSGEGDAGAILLQGDSLTVNFQDGSEIAAETNSAGSGGQVFAIAPNAITISGDGSLSTRSTGSGPAGDVSIRTGGLFRVQDGVLVEVSGQGTGDSGTLDVISGVTILDGGELSASTEAGNFGNIRLQIDSALLLRGDSLISARASNDANGGNVDISSPFIIALFPDGPNSDGNDIQASADAGDGGLITIKTNALFNLAENIAIEGNMTNDLDASSDTGINGEVIITNLEIDPIQGTSALATDPGTPTIAEGCQASGNGTSQFINSGRSGVAPSPYDFLSSAGIPDDIYPPGQTLAQQPAAVPPDAVPQVAPLPAAITEAQDWHKNTQGDIVLVAESPTYQSFCQRTSAPGVS